MSRPDGWNGTRAGAENADRVRAYLDGLASAGRGLPEREGKLNMSAIAVAAGVDRQVLYKNPAVKSAIEQAAASLGLEAYESLICNRRPLATSVISAF